MTLRRPDTADKILFGALLFGLLVVVFNEVFRLVRAAGPLGPMQAEYAPDPTPQLALLVIAVATLGLTKLVGWLRRRGSAEQ